MVRTVFLLLLLYSLGFGVLEIRDDVDTVIEKLRKEIADSQVLKPTHPVPFKQQFGVYDCNIRANSVGGPEQTFLRNILAIIDNNAFVTLWVSSILLEASQFSGEPAVSDHQLLYALEAISTYHDKNHKQNDSILVFWPQTYNKSADAWSCFPDNAGPVLELVVGDLEELDKILSFLGLSHLAEEVEYYMSILSNGMASFSIPADFDDTFVNLGFGALLSRYAPESISSAWAVNNTHFTEAMKALTKYAYRPLSKELDSSLIDPRTFFYMREYLYSVQERGIPAAFVSTWVQNVTEVRTSFASKYRMPFNVNNVDITVSANVIYGISAATLANLSAPREWFSPDLQMVYENTTDLISWLVERNFSARPDLVLAYYPALYNFYWFTARTLNLLSSANHLPFPVMERAKIRLSAALQNTTTNVLLKAAVVEEDMVYFDGFLGDADHDLFGKPVKYGEDRICSTAMAVNTLLYTWTEKGQLLPSTPAAVKDTVIRASKWLIKNTLSGDYKPYNTLFSGSVKSVDNLPYFYPANVHQYLNGSALPPGTEFVTADMVIGMKGIMSREDYDEQLQQRHYGRFTPMDFHGYNSASGWPFWSSKPFTYASAMLALTQYRALNFTGAPA